MAFIESPRFPERIAYGAIGGPGYSTGVAVMASGREARNGNWEYPRHSWDVSHSIKTHADFNVLKAFFMMAMGRKNGWRFKDWSDFTCTEAEGVVIGLTSTTFQLVKQYIIGSNVSTRLIRKPVTGTVAMFVSEVAESFVLDTTTGIATIATEPDPALVTWTGEFDVPMRFDTDELKGSLVSRNQGELLHSWESIPIIEVIV